MLFMQEVLLDLEDWCGTSTIRDRKTIMDRVEHEGLSFLTITLPKFGKDLEKGLDHGFVAHDHFAGFSRSGGLPRFLGGFLENVFDRKSGKLLPTPSLLHIHALRQLTLMFGKIQLPCSDARKAAAYDKYVETDDQTRMAYDRIDEIKLSSFDHCAMLLWANCLSRMDKSVHDGEVVPKHGPGSTAERLLGNSKWRQTEWTERLDREFPVVEFLLPNSSFYKELDRVSILSPANERPTRVVDVPKTLETPRIIAMEPVCMQYVQQGILAIFEREVEADDSARQLIGWQSSVPNQRLALIGSRNGALATLDLKDASDRVSKQLVRRLFCRFGSLLAAIDASRSRKAAVPGHGIISLAKFASMGSALTFPIEAMVFCTIVFVGIEKSLARSLTKNDVKRLLGQVRVYGDDIIVPVEYVSDVVEALEDFGLQVNSHKSFWTGKFRESCGKEYYDGSDVSIVRVRQVLPSQRRDVEEIVSTVSLRNQLYEAGLWRSTRYLDTLLERLIPFPVVGKESPVLGRHSFLGYETQRMCPRLHRPLVKGVVVRAPIPESYLDGSSALLKVLSNTGLPNPDEKHLLRSGRPRSIALRSGWSVSY